MSGYVAMSRRWQDHPLFKDDEFSRRDAWAWLIANAAWRPTRVRTATGPVILQRGELCFSIRFMAAKWGWSRPRVDRFLQLLRAEAMIEARPKACHQARQQPGQQTCHVENVITICNYDKFQTVEGEARATKRATNRATNRDKEEPLKPVNQLGAANGGSKMSLLPLDWQPPPKTELPPQARDMARQWPAGGYEREAENFGLYWRSARKMKADWRATWANWIHRAHAAQMRAAKAEPQSSWRDIVGSARH